MKQPRFRIACRIVGRTAFLKRLNKSGDFACEWRREDAPTFTHERALELLRRMAERNQHYWDEYGAHIMEANDNPYFAADKLAGRGYVSDPHIYATGTCP